MPPVDDQNPGADQTDDQIFNQPGSGSQPGSSFNPQAQLTNDSVDINSDLSGQAKVGGLQNDILPPSSTQTNTSPIENTVSTSANYPDANLANNISMQDQQIDSTMASEPSSPSRAQLPQSPVDNSTQFVPGQSTSFDNSSMTNSDFSAQSAQSQPPSFESPSMLVPDLSNQSQSQTDNSFQPTDLAPGQPESISTPNPPIDAVPPLATDSSPDSSSQPVNDFYDQSQGGGFSYDQGGDDYMMPDTSYSPSSSGKNKMIIILAAVGIVILALVTTIVYVLTRKPAENISSQPVQVEQSKVEEVTIEFNKEITVPAGYVLVENDCYKTIVVQENALKKADNCSLSGTYGKKALSSLNIADSTKLVSTDDIKNSTADKIKQAINSAQTTSDVTIDIVSIENIKLGQADAVKVIYNMTSANETTKMVNVFVIAPKDRYKTSAGATIESFVLSGSYGDSFSQENFDKIINNWSWK